MARVFDVRIDIADLANLADKLTRVGSTAGLNEALLQATNDVARETYVELLSRLTSGGARLSDTYLREHTTLTLADSPAALAARIETDGRIAGLGHYFTGQLMTAVRWPTSKPFQGNPRKAGSPLGYIPRVGDPGRGIPVGQKQSGVRVNVKGSDQALPNAFVIPGKRSASDGTPKVFERVGPGGKVGGGTRFGGVRSTGRGSIRMLVSLSTYQLMLRQTDPEFLDGVGQKLASRVTAAAAAEIEKEIAA